MQSLKYLLSLGLLWLLLGNAQGQTLHVCIPDVSSPPRTFPDHDGQVQYLIRRAVSEQGWAVEFIPVPWRRCLAGVASGRYDAVATAPANTNTQHSLSFPMHGGQLDQNRASAEYVLRVFRPLGGKAGWDGRHFTGLETPVLIRAGAIGLKNWLAGVGAVSEDSAKSVPQIMQMLLHGRAQIGVGSQDEVLLALQSVEVKGQIELLPGQLGRTLLYTGVNKSFYAREPGTTEAIWTAIGRIQRTPEWQQLAPKLAQ
ncbi:MAG: hypothetical protein WA173_01735 [Pseudomonas sp.]|uniref:substrate-binding periplasmic protein n=1 Tax=Pseudomonas sp. TaxID=306 RepID=UPI003BB6F999